MRKAQKVPVQRVIFAGLMLSAIFISVPALAAVSCNPQGGITTIGLEWVASQCMADGTNDNTTIYYIVNALECDGSRVILFAPYGDQLDSPNTILNGVKSTQKYRIFRNKEGSHIIAVHKDYRGLIDGKDMDNYPYGTQVYTDVFKEGFILPTRPKCKGGDYNICMEQSAESTVNLGSGRLSHSQELFNLSGSNPLFLGVSLHYRSIPFASSAIGNGWSHTFEAKLQTGTGGSMILWDEGKRTLYNKYSTIYVPPRGNTSTLIRNADSTWTITERDGLKRNFDTVGNLSSIVDRFGNALTLGYTAGKLTTVTDANSRGISFTYYADGKLEKIFDPALHEYTFVYTDGKLTSVTPPGDNGAWNYTYAANGLMETKTDPGQNRAEYTYYSDKKLQTAKDPVQKTRSYTYPTSTELGGSGKVPDYFPLSVMPQHNFVLTEKDQNPWGYTYDTLSMRIRTATDPLGNKTTYYYNGDGTMRAVTRPFDGDTKLTTFYTYDGYGNMLTRTDPVDISGYSPEIDPQTVNIASLASLSPPIKTAVRYTYDNANYDRILSVTDERITPNWTVTFAYTLESGGEVTTVTLPWGTVALKRNPDGTVTEYVDENGKVALFEYYPVTTETIAAGSAGQLWKITGPDGISVSVTGYDKNGNPLEAKLTDSNGTDRVVATLNHDALNRLKTLINTTAGLPDNVTRFDYDLVGNLKSLIDAESHETKYEYTYDKQIKKIINTVNGLPVETVLEYSGSGCPSCGGGVDKLTAVKDPNHVKKDLPGTVYTYDAAGRLETETDPIGKKFRYAYYDNGLLKAKYDVTGGVPGTLLVTYTYNNRGQLENKLFTDGTYTQYTYYPDGRLETAANKNISYTYLYYDNGRLWKVTDSNGREIRYDEYDGVGQRKQVTFFSGTADERVIRYDYDGANRLWKIIAGAGTFTYAYDPLGRRDTLTYPYSTVADFDFDDLNRLTAITHRVSGGAAFASYSYPVYDQVGNVKSVTGDRNATYFYDSIYRILSTVSASTEEYVWDFAGNRSSGPGLKDTVYSANDANQLMQGRKLGYEYDNRGNQTVRTVPDATDKTWTQTWDHENQLVNVEKIKGSERKTVSFKYDPFGRRIEKTVETVIDGIPKTVIVTYIYDNEDIALEILTENGTTTKTFYTHGPGIDEPLAMERGGQYYYYHTDGLGSVVSITDAAHNDVQSYEYDSFGMVTPSTSFVNTYTYTSREWDKETGLYYYRARYYDPMDGRFISKDPIGFAGGDVNLYGYVQNNPVNAVDPLGLYGSNVHYDLTKQLALDSGFCEKSAQTIAASDQGVDDSFWTGPITGIPFFSAFHFRSRKYASTGLRLAIDSGDIIQFGKFLHIFQDTYSHKGYFYPIGHAIDSLRGRDPDTYDYNTARDAAMTLNTRFYLDMFQKKMENVDVHKILVEL